MNFFRQYKFFSLIALLALLAELPAMPFVMCETGGEVLLEEFHIVHEHPCEEEHSNCNVTTTEGCDDVLVSNNVHWTKRVKPPLIFAFFTLFLPLLLTQISLRIEHLRRNLRDRIPILSNYYPLVTVLRN